jgi:hypothetical protein
LQSVDFRESMRAAVLDNAAQPRTLSDPIWEKRCSVGALGKNFERKEWHADDAAAPGRRLLTLSALDSLHFNALVAGHEDQVAGFSAERGKYC